MQPLQHKVPTLQLSGTGEGARVIQPQTPLMPPSLGEGLPTSQGPQPQEGTGGSTPLQGFTVPPQAQAVLCQGAELIPPHANSLRNAPGTPRARQEILRMRKMWYRIASAFFHETPAPPAARDAPQGFRAG